MSQSQIDDVRKTLLKLYSDNTLEFAGFGLGTIIALATELTGHVQLSTLLIPYFSISLFLPVLFSTLVFGAWMFFKSAYWGRAAAVLVTEQSGFQPKSYEPDLMKAMYDYHLDKVRKTTRGGCLLYEIGHSSFWKVVFASILAFMAGVALAYFY